MKPISREVPVDTSFNVLDTSGTVIATLVTTSTKQSWTWDLDKGSAWPSHGFTMKVVTAAGPLGSNTQTYAFENAQTWHDKTHTIYGPYYIVKYGSERWRFQYDATNAWLYWLSNTDSLLPDTVGATLEVSWDGKDHEHTDQYYRKDGSLS